MKYLYVNNKKNGRLFILLVCNIENKSRRGNRTQQKELTKRQQQFEMFGLSKVFNLRKKKDEVLDCLSEVQTRTKQIKPKNVVSKCGKVRSSG